MKKLVLIIYLVFIFSGGLAAYYGLTHENQFLAGIGLFGLGIGLVLIGIDDIVTRESVEQDDAGYVSTYRGWSAIFGGVLWIVLGITSLVSAGAVLLGQQDFLLQWVMQHPGLGLIGLGLAALGSGGRILFGAEEQKDSTLSFVVSLPGRIFGLIVIFIGLALMAAGVVEILFPVLFQSGIAAFQTWWKDLQCQMNPTFCGK